MDGERDDRIRNRAYEIWESQDRPEGREREHWEQACRDCAAEDENAPGAAPDSASTGVGLSSEPQLRGPAADGDQESVSGQSA